LNVSIEYDKIKSEHQHILEQLAHLDEIHAMRKQELIVRQHKVDQEEMESYNQKRQELEEDYHQMLEEAYKEYNRKLEALQDTKNDRMKQRIVAKRIEHDGLGTTLTEERSGIQQEEIAKKKQAEQFQQYLATLRQNLSRDQLFETYLEEMKVRFRRKTFG
jgi:hypothetical protein